MGESTLKGNQIRQFHDMCVKYRPPKCVAFNFGFHFCVWDIYVYILNTFEKKSRLKFKK
jgi:hypothetical protein